VRALDVDFLAFSYHKLLAPFGVGVLYGRQHLLESSLPFLYGGDMIAEGQVFPDRVGYNVLPWKYAAGTPNILGTIVSGQAVRLLLDLALSPRRPAYFRTGKLIERAAVQDAMGRVTAWNRQLTARALDGLAAIPGITIYGPREAERRTSLVAFNLPGHDPILTPSCWTGPRSPRPGPPAARTTSSNSASCVSSTWPGRMTTRSGRSGKAVHPMDVAAGHPQRGVVLADGLLIRPVEEAVHLAPGVVVQLDLAHAELIGCAVAGVIGDLCDGLGGQLQILVKVHEPRHDMLLCSM
jgi:hypothetical protein